MDETLTLRELVNEVLFVEEFCARLDIIVRYMAVKSMAEEKKVPPVFAKMDVLRKITLGKRNDHVFDEQRLLRTISRTKKEGVHNPDVPIIVGHNHRLVEGAHRLATFIYFDIKEVHIERWPRDGAPLDIRWFIEHLTQKELLAVLETERELRERFR